MLLVTPSTAPGKHWCPRLNRWLNAGDFNGLYWGRYGDGPRVIESCPIAAAWAACVAARRRGGWR